MGVIVKNSSAARSKNSFSAVLWYHSTILRTAYRKQFYPRPMAPMDEGVPFASLESLTRHFADCRKVQRDHHEKLKMCT